MKELIIGAKLENMERVMAFVEAEIADCPQEIKNKLAIVVDEIFSNIAKYAYYPQSGDAVVRMSVGDEIVIEFADSGAPYNPLEKADPDITASASDREIGGLGVFMVKRIMDEVRYEYRDGQNVLVLRKKI
ncbi:MAG: ATP-binding protein [Defluviitaleaceae bacterium]|nr:ATP-binding protein [Defluviitaleaceae bacterium]